jgi:hypothetical protein
MARTQNPRSLHDPQTCDSPVDSALAERHIGEAMTDLMRAHRDDRGPLDQLWIELTTVVRHDQGEAAREHLSAGHPIYYVEGDTPDDLLVKEYPDGRRELVRFHETGDQVVRPL